MHKKPCTTLRRDTKCYQTKLLKGARRETTLTIQNVKNPILIIATESGEKELKGGDKSVRHWLVESKSTEKKWLECDKLTGKGVV